MKYFVTGATGFVGGRVARQLRAEGHEVIAIARTPSKARDLVELGVVVHSGDVTDLDSLCEPMRGVDGVYHIAGWYKVGSRQPEEGERTNVQGTHNVLSMMKALGIAKGVYTSTLAVNSDTRGKQVNEDYRFTGRHISVYDRTKAEAHHIAERFIADGLPLVIVQPGLIYGPGDTSSVRWTFVQYLKRQLPMIPAGASYSWAHVDDIAEAHRLALTHGQAGRHYFICGPTHTLVEALAMAEQITGVPAPRLHGQPGLIKALSAMMKPFDRLLPVPETYTSEGLRVIAGVTYIGDNTRARTELGWAPRDLRVGLEQTLRHEMQLLGMSTAP